LLTALWLLRALFCFCSYEAPFKLAPPEDVGNGLGTALVASKEGKWGEVDSFYQVFNLFALAS
jgi:hypothetical protein